MKIAVPPAPFYPGRDFFASYAIPLRVLHVERSPPYPLHRHEFNELVVVYGGSGRHLVDGVESALSRGDVLFIPRGSSHAYSDPRDLCYVNVIFGGALLSEEGWTVMPESAFPQDGAASGWRGFRLSATGAREIHGIITRIDQELFNRKVDYGFMARALFMELWCTLGRKSAERDEESSSVSERIGRIIRSLEREGGPEVSVVDLAEDAGTCVRNFRREFKKLTGKSPLAYLAELRLERACGLLLDSDKTVTQIAGLVGYDDGNYFARQFKRLKGLSPKRFREAGRQS